MSTLDRRVFLAGTVAASLAAPARAQSIEGQPETPGSLGDEPNSPHARERRVVVGVMGLRRGQALADRFASQPHVQIKYVCDVDQREIAESLKKMNGRVDSLPQGIGDFRHILDDQEVDALVCAAPNHWHAPATILACQAGKHVYVEKPCCHNPWEGEQMVAAARKHQRAVQVGTQRRSSVGTIAAMQQLRGGAIGRVYHARCWYFAHRGSIGTCQPSTVPTQLDYELWQGPAPRRPFKENVVHYNWHWNWHWGNGELGNNGVHTLDLARWGLDVDYPSRVASSGGRYRFQDDQQTPDTQTVSYEFDGGGSISWQGLSCNRHGDGFVTFYGEQGALDLQLDGTYVIYDEKDKELSRYEPSNQGDNEHIANFLAAVRSGTPTQLNAEVEDSNKSTLLCHLGNIAQRLAQTITCDTATGAIVDCSQASAFWKRDYAEGWEPSV